VTIHWEVLPEEARQVLKLLAGQPWVPDFYLAGGTGLALQIGHRISVDLDLFSASDSLSFESRSRIVSSLEGAAGQGRFTVDQEKEGTLDVRLHGIGISLFHYTYPLVAPLVPILGGLKAASLEDIGLMKIAGIIGRGSKRDFLDLYFVGRSIPLKQLLELGATKFPHVRDFAPQAARALVYFEDAEGQRMPKMLQPVTWEEVKRYFLQEIGQMSREWFDI